MGDHTQRMGRVMPFEDAAGAQHPASFWCLSRLLIEIERSQITLHFVGYHDVASYNADRSPISGAVREYQLAGEAYFDAIQKVTQFPTGTPITAELLTMAWEVATATEDVAAPVPEEGEEQEPPVSFFADAAPV